MGGKKAQPVIAFSAMDGTMHLQLSVWQFSPSNHFGLEGLNIENLIQYEQVYPPRLVQMQVKYF